MKSDAWDEKVLVAHRAYLSAAKAQAARQAAAIGRNARVFCDSKIGGTASANLYSPVMSARDNGLEPYLYLRHLFEHLPQASTVEDLEVLLPWNVAAAIPLRAPLGA